MTKKETAQLIRYICAAYPNWKPMDIAETIDAWWLMLQDEDFNEITAALKSYVKGVNSAFPPSVGQIMEQLTNIKKIASGKQDLTEVEAWSLVLKALRNSNYNSEEEFEKLPEVIKRTIGGPAQLREWAKTDLEQLNVTEKNAFFRSYKAARDFVKIEGNIKRDVAGIGMEVLKRLEEKNK